MIFLRAVRIAGNEIRPKHHLSKHTVVAWVRADILHSDFKNIHNTTRQLAIAQFDRCFASLLEHGF